MRVLLKNVTPLLLCPKTFNVFQQEQEVAHHHHPHFCAFYRAVLIDCNIYLFIFLNCHSSAAARVSLTIRSIWNRCEAPWSMPKVCLLCVVAILRSLANWDTSHIRLFCLHWIRGQKKWNCGLEVLKRGSWTALPLLADLEEMTECSCVVHRVGQSVLSDRK